MIPKFLSILATQFIVGYSIMLIMQSPQLHVYKISNCINPLTIDKLIKDTRQGEPKFEEQNCIPLGELFAF